MSSDFFYTGYWINWSKGYVLGATLTVESKQGALLIAFLALFVSFTGSQLWGLVCFVLHQLQSSPDERDILHLQLQALLRIGLSSLSMLARFTRVSWDWRSRTTRLWRRTAPLIAACLIHFSIVAIAGIFSSRMVDASGEALIKRSSNCGWYDNSVAGKVQGGGLTDNDLAAIDTIISTGRTAITRGKEYSRACYPKIDGSQPSDTFCSSTVVPFIQSTVNLSATCPFQSGACNGPAARFDTGWVDSHDHLGVNAPPKDRVQIRKTTTCVPIPLEQKYSSDWYDIPGLSYRWKSYYFGSWPDEYAFQYNKEAAYTISNFSLQIRDAYSPVVITSFADNTLMSQGFTFIPAFAQTDADVSFLLLLNNVAFSRQVNDSIFLAQNATKLYLIDPVTAFISNVSLSTLGCTERYQLCGTDVCTNPGGYYQLASASTMRQLNLNAKQNATAHLLLESLFESQVNWLFYFMSSEMLLARDKVPRMNAYNPTNFTDPYAPMYIYSSALSDNQWHLESEQIHNVAVAMLQLATSRYAIPLNTTIGHGMTTIDYIVAPDTAEGKSLCGQQKLHSTSHSSFSVFALAFTIATGSLIIMLSHAVPAIVAQAQKRSGRPKPLYQREEWIQNDVLQLLRVVLTHAGGSYWATKHNLVSGTAGLRKRNQGFSESDESGEGEEDSTALCANPEAE